MHGLAAGHFVQVLLQTREYIGKCQLAAFGALFYLDDVVAKLGFYQAWGDLAGFGAEDGLFEFRHHLAAAKLAQIATLFAARAGGVLGCQGSKAVRVGLYLFQNALCLGFGQRCGQLVALAQRQQDVAGYSTFALLEVLRVGVVVRLAGGFVRRGEAQLLIQQGADGLAFVGRVKTTLAGFLQQQLVQYQLLNGGVARAGGVFVVCLLGLHHGFGDFYAVYGNGHVGFLWRVGLLLPAIWRNRAVYEGSFRNINSRVMDLCAKNPPGGPGGRRRCLAAVQCRLFVTLSGGLAAMLPIVTTRLRLREFVLADAPFVLLLLNDPDFIRFIADKRVRSLVQAQQYLADGPLASYAANGFGLWCVERLCDGQPVGMCGLIRRHNVPDVDVGYAFMPAARGYGYAVEAAAAARAYGLGELGLPRVVGFIDPANLASARVLQAIGLQSQGLVAFPGAEGDTELFA